MKTKKLFLFAAIFLFLNVFFVRVDYAVNIAKADAECDACFSDPLMSDCEYACRNTGNSTTTNDQTYYQEPDFGVPDAPAYNDAPYNEDLSSCNAFESPSCCENKYNGGYWYGDTCNSYPEPVYNANDTDTWTMDNFPTNNPTDSGGNSANCDPDPSCMWYNCCSSQDATVTEISAPSAAELAAARKAENEAKSDALAKTAIQNAATKDVNAKTNIMQAACSSSATQSPACIKAQQDLNDAKDAYDRATADARTAIENANALSGAAGLNPNTGAGFVMCANGILGTVCEGGGGTPYVAGIPTGGYNGGYSPGGGLPGNYGSGPTGGVSQKCGANFQDIGGICFPTNTGLSSTPIYVIVSNIFSWLMGLFTTLAVLAFVVSGIQYFMASGDEDMAEKAKENATHAIIGIIVGLSGFIIIKAIAAALTGQSMFF